MHQKFAWADVPLEVISPQFSRRLITGEKLMLAHVHLKVGCVVPNHAHFNEQASYVLSGSLRFWVGDKVDSENLEDSTVLKTGEVLTIPGNVPHRAVALEDTLALDVFTPPRADWLAGTDAYLRKSGKL